MSVVVIVLFAFFVLYLMALLCTTAASRSPGPARIRECLKALADKFSNSSNAGGMTGSAGLLDNLDITKIGTFVFNSLGVRLRPFDDLLVLIS